MHAIGDFGAFKLYQPAASLIPASERRRRRVRERNEAHLRRRGRAEPGNAPKPITGSFVCAHAPDYVGTPTLTWDEARWRRLFASMGRAGLDTVVWQASAWKELREVYYRSTAFGRYRTWHVVEPMLLAARAEGLRVFLGGYGSVVGWTAGLSQRAIACEQARQWRCMRELLVFGELFDGVYFSPETAFTGARDPVRELRLNTLYRAYFRRLKEAAPAKRILMSPASKYFPKGGDAFVASWRALLDGVPLDILAPQDSIGCGGCALSEQRAMWRRWRRVAEGGGLSLWANIELFERRHFGGEAPFVAARPERVLAQLAHVSPWVEKCICWEYPFFALEAEGAAPLRAALFRKHGRRPPALRRAGQHPPDFRSRVSGD